jgi:hypothetical protein
MVRTFLMVYIELGSYFLSLQEQIKDIIERESERERLEGTPVTEEQYQERFWLEDWMELDWTRQLKSA